MYQFVYELLVIRKSISTLLTVFAKWHCRNRLAGGCLNGGTCDSDSGTCSCVEGFEGFNCGLATGERIDFCFKSIVFHIHFRRHCLSVAAQMLVLVVGQ